MPGTALAAGVVAVAATLTVGLVGAGAASAYSQRVAAAADAAALAAADAASGAIDGEPCARAAEVAEAMALTVTGCDLDELIATVRVSGSFARLGADAVARAGPPMLLPDTPP